MYVVSPIKMLSQGCKFAFYPDSTLIPSSHFRSLVVEFSLSACVAAVNSHPVLYSQRCYTFLSFEIMNFNTWMLNTEYCLNGC